MDELLQEHADLLSRIKLSYGSGSAAFDSDLLGPIRNFAGLVNALPATPANYFCEPEGLFRLGLEVGFTALQGSDGRLIEGRSTISVRSRLEPRWRQAVFLGGLCIEAHHIYDRVQVRAAGVGQWPAYTLGLTEWARANNLTQVELSWSDRVQVSRALNVFALARVAPRSLIQHLDDGNRIIVPQLLSSLADAPLYHGVNALEELVRRAGAHVIYRDLLRSSKARGVPIVGEHLVRFLTDAMRRLVVDNPKWGPNQEKSRVWLASEGLFVVWPNGAAEVAAQLEAEQLPGIPTDPEVIVDVLAGAGVIIQAPDGEWLWRIRPPGSTSAHSALRFADSRVLLPTNLGIRAIADRIVVQVRAGPAAARKEAAQTNVDTSGEKDDRRPEATGDPSAFEESENPDPSSWAPKGSAASTPRKDPSDAASAPQLTRTTGGAKPRPRPSRRQSPETSPPAPPTARERQPDPTETAAAKDISTPDAPSASIDSAAAAEPEASFPAGSQAQARPTPPKPSPVSSDVPIAVPSLPLRLDKAVRRAVHDAIDPKDGTAPQAVRMSDGRLFLPMNAFAICGMNRPDLLRTFDVAGLGSDVVEPHELHLAGAATPGIALNVAAERSEAPC